MAKDRIHLRDEAATARADCGDIEIAWCGVAHECWGGMVSPSTLDITEQTVDCPTCKRLMKRAGMLS